LKVAVIRQGMKRPVRVLENLDVKNVGLPHLFDVLSSVVTVPGIHQKLSYLCGIFSYFHNVILDIN